MKQTLVISITGALLIILWDKLPLADKASYFNFADIRTMFNLANAGDVLSNIPFLVVGIWGLLLVRSKKSLLVKEYSHSLNILALGTILTCFGSMYFHLNPNLDTLFWDRLPMTIGFTGLISLIVTDRLNLKWGYVSSYFLVFAGMISVIGWHYSWFSLRPYLCVQYGCLIFALLTMVLTPSNIIKNSQIMLSLLLYILAKVTEYYDHQIFSQLQFMSGHTLKHLLAAVAILIIFQPLVQRTTSR